jgi:fatty-acid desaturase
MTRAERTANLIGVVVPFMGVLGAIALLWNHEVDGTDLAIFLAMYLLSAVGITVGFHRLLTHRAFQTGSRYSPPAAACPPTTTCSSGARCCATSGRRAAS